MKNIIGIVIFCMPFFSFVSAAENPEQSPFVTRGKDLGDTGAAKIPPTPKQRKLIKNYTESDFSEAFLKAENLHESPRGRLKPGFINNHKSILAPELSNPPAKK